MFGVLIRKNTKKCNRLVLGTGTQKEAFVVYQKTSA